MKSTRTRYALMMACAVMAVGAATPAFATPVQWDINPNLSFVRLTIPDQNVTVGTTSGTLRIRDANNNAWSDAGGRRAFLDGTIESNLVDGSSVQFLSGAQNIFALEQTNLRPNPAAFNPANTNTTNPDGQYGNTSTALAALGGKVRASVSILTVDLAFLAFRDVLLDLGSGVVPLGGGTTIGANTTQLGIQSSIIDVDGISALIVGQVVPDIANEPLTVPNVNNAGVSVITVIDPITRQLTYSISIPLTLDLDGTLVTGSIAGQIVAVGIVPEPSSIALMGLGTAALGLTVYRRRRVRK